MGDIKKVRNKHRHYTISNSNGYRELKVTKCLTISFMNFIKMCEDMKFDRNILGKFLTNPLEPFDYFHMHTYINKNLEDSGEYIFIHPVLWKTDSEEDCEYKGVINALILNNMYEPGIYLVQKIDKNFIVYSMEGEDDYLDKDTVSTFDKKVFFVTIEDKKLKLGLPM